MPRTTADILAHADELADRFEAHVPDPARIRDATTLRLLADAVVTAAHAAEAVETAVAAARADGHTWSSIGDMLGTSGEAARQRYGPLAARGGTAR